MMWNQAAASHPCPGLSLPLVAHLRRARPENDDSMDHISMDGIEDNMDDAYYTSRTPPARRQLFAASSLASRDGGVVGASQLMKLRVERFVNMEDAAIHSPSKCLWHESEGVGAHAINLESVFIFNTGACNCSVAFWKFMNCAPQRAPCKTCGLSFNFCKKSCHETFSDPNFCYKCCVHHGVRGTANNCGPCLFQDRLKGLVFWAFRSSSGHHLVKHMFEADNTRPELGQYPEIIPCNMPQPENSKKWKKAMAWLSSSEPHNLWFWKSVMEAAELLKHPIDEDF
jgi:hypothetical protein